MKKLIYIFLGFVAMSFVACSKDSSFGAETEGVKTIPTTTPQDTTKNDPGLDWNTVKDKGLNFDENMMAYPTIEWWCTNGALDTCRMEPWFLDINTTDLVVYRTSYQSTSRSGITPDAERSSENEVKDKLGNLVVRHHYTQAFRFNNFDHKINGSWTTGRIFYNNGKEESYLPEDGLYYEIASISGNTVADTTHFVRNDSIFAKEIVKLTYKATLKIAQKSNTRRSWERSATVTVISFVDIVKHEEEIPTAEEYVANLKWHAVSGNRLFKKIGEDSKGDIGYWEDGFLMSSDTHFYMLIVHYTVNAKDGKSDEKYVGKEIITLSKSEMATPTSADREYNGVMYDFNKKKYIPCRLSEDYSFRYGSRYADGTAVTYMPDINGSIMDGVKNFAKDKDASPSPWLETVCNNTPYDGKNYYTVTLKSSVHTNVTTIADASLKK
jgi:hypothetical protein